MARTVEIVTPSRLHFGMFSFGRPDVRQFGGVGVMIDRPGVHLRISPGNALQFLGPLAGRMATVVDRLVTAWQLEKPPALQFEVLNEPLEHAGLGTGTQLELAVTAGLNTALGREPLGAEQLARISGRGARSAIGTYGFLHGGLLVESGKLPGEVLSPLEQRVSLPGEWRFVLILLPGRGLAGEAERSAFGRLPPVKPEVTARLRAEVVTELIPAALEGQFERFADSLYRFNREAGMCFAASQAGPYANRQTAHLIERLRTLGIRGIGQSSWGPTVFALVEDDRRASLLIDELVHLIDPQTALQIARVAPLGATVRVEQQP